MRAVDHLHKDKYSQEMVDVFASCSGFLNIFAKMYARSSSIPQALGPALLLAR